MGSKPMREPSGAPREAPGTSSPCPSPVATVRSGVPSHAGAAAAALTAQVGPEFRVVATALAVVAEDCIRSSDELELLLVGLDVHRLAGTGTVAHIQSTLLKTSRQSTRQ